MQRMVSDLFGALIVSAITIILAVSIASIVYTGPLQPFLTRGIGTTLLAAAITMAIGTALYSYRGTVTTPQDLTAILLASAAATVAAQIGPGAPETLFATVLMLLVTASAVTGVTLLALGWFRLSAVIRFIPYPVMGGFLAATGFMLVTGAIGSLLGQPVGLGNVDVAVSQGNLLVWAPWIAAAALALAVVYRIRHRLVLPAVIFCLAGLFYLYLVVTGTGLDTAAARGWLLGPFPPGGFLTGLSVDVIGAADWSLISGQFLSILAVVVMAVLGCGLALSSVEMIVGHPIRPDRDFRTTGLAILLSGPTGGLINYPGIASTTLGYRLGTGGRLLGLTVVAGHLLIAFAGADLLELLPRGLFGATIAFLGFDLLFTWVWVARQRLVAADYAVILLILAVSATIGFLEALALGLAMSVLFFVISYARQDVVRIKSSLALRRSTIERGLQEMEVLRGHGDSVVVFECSGYLFFGTASRLKTEIETSLASAPPPAAIVLDFTRVPDIDPSAAQAVQQIAELCRSHGIRPVLSSLADPARAKYRRFCGAEGITAVHPTLDAALQAEEDRILADHPPDTEAPGSFVEALRQANPGIELATHFTPVTLLAGEVLFHAGDTRSDMFLLIEGTLHVTVDTARSNGAPIARLRPGSLIGEIAFFGDAQRSADIRAATDARLYLITADTLARLETTHPAFALSFLTLAARTMARRMDRTTRLLGAVLD